VRLGGVGQIPFFLVSLALKTSYLGATTRLFDRMLRKYRLMGIC